MKTRPLGDLLPVNGEKEEGYAPPTSSRLYAVV
jgi:hypothetical protein